MKIDKPIIPQIYNMVGDHLVKPRNPMISGRDAPPAGLIAPFRFPAHLKMPEVSKWPRDPFV